MGLIGHTLHFHKKSVENILSKADVCWYQLQQFKRSRYQQDIAVNKSIVLIQRYWPFALVRKTIQYFGFFLQGCYTYFIKVYIPSPDPKQ